MNDLKTYNNTNIYPNLKIWSLLDKEKKYVDEYNRYAHIKINLQESSSIPKNDLFKSYFLDTLDINCTLEQLQKIRLSGNKVWINFKKLLPIN